jgi:ribosomal protein S17E
MFVMKLPDAFASKMARPMLKFKKVSPQIMFGAGVVGVVGAGVLACRATLHLDDVLVDHQDRVDKINNIASQDEEYAETTQDKHLAAAKIKLVVGIAKLYAPAAGVAALSIALLTGSHVTLTRRNAAGAAAYATLDQAYKRYRAGVIEKYGTETDDELRHGVTTVEEIVTDEAGKTKKVKNKRSGGLSEYAQLFTEGNKNWDSNANNNWFFLNQQQRYWNDRLQTHGHVFLNEILDALGLERTKAGQVVGWIAGEYQRDGYIDFGLGDNPDRVRDFMANGEGNCWIDFNVDGMILDMI